MTISGAVVTQTVTSAPVVGSTSDPSPPQRKGLSGGAIAGAVIGVLLGIAAILFGAFLLWRRRKQTGDPEGSGAGSGAGTGRGPSSAFRRKASLMSKTGLLNEKEAEEPLYVNIHTGSNSVRQSMMLVPGAGVGDGVSPVSPLGRYDVEYDGARRHSRPLVYDQRLNPSVLFANAENNGSRVSMMDQQDYSRPLGIANPDARASFESRAD